MEYPDFPDAPHPRASASTAQAYEALWLLHRSASGDGVDPDQGCAQLGKTQGQLAERISVTPRSPEATSGLLSLEAFDVYVGYLRLDAADLLTGELRDKIPAQRVKPDDASPKGCRKKS